MLEQSPRFQLRPAIRRLPQIVPLPWIRRGGTVLLFGILGLISVLGISWGRKWLTSTSLGPLFIESEALDFGKAWNQKDFRWLVPIRNDAHERITFELRSSCECTIVDEPVIEVEPGQTHEVALSLDLTPRGPDEMESPTRPFQVTLTAVPKSGSMHVQQWVLSGLVKSPFHVTPPYFDLGREIPRGHSIENMALTVRCFEPISDITINSDSGALSTAVTRISRERFEVQLMFADSFTAAIGKFTTRIRISAQGAKGTLFDPQMVVLSGAVVGPLNVEPDHIQFGLRNIGDHVDGSFAIRARGDVRFRLVRIDAPRGHGAFTLGPIELPSTYRRDVRIPFHQAITELGHSQQVVEFLLELKGTKEQFREKALVRYHGVEGKNGA